MLMHAAGPRPAVRAERLRAASSPQIWGGTVAENATLGAVVGTVAGAPGDGGTIINFALTDSAGGKFVIDAATGVVTVASGAQFDYETVPSLTIGVRTTDADGSISDKNSRLL